MAIDRILASAFGVFAVDLVANNQFNKLVVWQDRKVEEVSMKGYRRLQKCKKRRYIIENCCFIGYICWRSHKIITKLFLLLNEKINFISFY